MLFLSRLWVVGDFLRPGKYRKQLLGFVFIAPRTRFFSVVFAEQGFFLRNFQPFQPQIRLHYRETETRKAK